MTNIEWTDVTWDPVTGCSKVSAGHEDRLTAPLKWRKPRKVFVNSMSDLFHDDVPDSFIDRVFAVMAMSPQHTFQVLTKRPERMRRYTQNELPMRWLRTDSWNRAAQEIDPSRLFELEHGIFQNPLPNVWLGASVENQSAADERIPHLLATPAAVRFLSCEPLLGPVDLWRHTPSGAVMNLGPVATGRGLDWVIVGGESGPGARPCDVAWVRSVVQQCQSACVPVFVKQLGSYAILDPRYDRSVSGWTRKLRDRKGGDPAEWPEDLRVREFPAGRAT